MTGETTIINILRDVLLNKGDSSEPMVQELEKITRRFSYDDNAVLVLGEAEPVRHRSFRLTRNPKKKVTFYLTPETEWKLEEVKTRLKMLVSDRHGLRISKSAIVDNALKIMLREFELKGEDSILLRQMIRNTGKT